jgi:hypothetical protein
VVGAYFYMGCSVASLQLWILGIFIQYMGYGFSIFLGLVLSGCGCGVVWTLSYEQEVLQTNMPILKKKKNYCFMLCGGFWWGIVV